jgi:hypothetical protein
MMKSKGLVCALFVVMSFNVFAQNGGGIVTAQEYYDFFNSIKKPSAETHFILVSEPERYSLSKNSDEDDYNIFDTLFSKRDSTFLKEQVIKANKFVWGPGMINGSKVVNRSDIDELFKEGMGEGWDKFYKIYGNGGYWAYSVPLFSKDKNICVVKYSNHCGGLCGAGYIYYYKKTNGKWAEVYHYMTWIS